MLWPQYNVVRVTRTGADGVPRIAFIGYIADAVHDRDAETTQLTVNAPESLIVEGRSPPFPPPLQEHVRQTDVFEFWWKQLDYVFDLPDPRSFPPLPDVMSSAERDVVDRYVRVGAELASSALLNAVREGFNVRMPNGVTGPEEIEAQFSGTDVQAGFAVLLRQCDSPKERADFERVRNLLWVKSQSEPDDSHAERLRQLTAWGAARKQLKVKSLNQLLRDKLARDGLPAFQYQEEHSPTTLMSLYNYGDLIHWDKKATVIAQFETDAYIESDRRLAYLDSASGLAHLYIGFAELARSAVGRVIPAR